MTSYEAVLEMFDKVRVLADLDGALGTVTVMARARVKVREPHESTLSKQGCLRRGDRTSVSKGNRGVPERRGCESIR